jgi:acyl carrier protein
MSSKTPIREQDVKEWLVGYLAEFLEVPVGEVDPTQDFHRLGLDSVDAIMVGGALEDRFDIEIDATLFLRCRNIDELLGELRRSSLL